MDELSRGVARACDRALDLLVLAFAAWTVSCHACLLLRLGVGWAAAGASALLVAGALLLRGLAD
ncbi:MAG: hypothetical protein ACRDPC_20110, partial [Solirubrobacteraceae bacterium]